MGQDIFLQNKTNMMQPKDIIRMYNGLQFDFKWSHQHIEVHNIA